MEQKSILLDEYSQAVTSLVESAAPAVVALAVQITGQQGTQVGAGSGAVIAPDGYILTNSHVVAGAEAIEVHFTDGTVLGALVAGIDPPTDLAVVRVSLSGLHHLPIGDSNQLRVGHFVIAIGNPLGFDSTVSTGVVSALGRGLRSLDGRLIENVIQHTAPINPGSSGGPLINARGELIGLNTAIIAMSQGIAFAIPSNTASWVVSQLLSYGRVRRGYLGIGGAVRPVDRRLILLHHLTRSTAVQVISIDPGGPAARAGVRVGDLIVRIGTEDVANMDDVYRFLTEWPWGSEVGITVVRAGRRLTLTVVPAEAGEPSVGIAGTGYP